MRKGDIGAHVAAMQRQLNASGIKVVGSGFFDADTELAVIQFQLREHLVADGVVGPKTLAVLINGDHDKKALSETDLINAAERLGVQLAAIKAVNQVESRGRGFIDDGRPVILFERHVMYDRLKINGLDAVSLAEKFPNLVNKKRGGYAGGPTEYARLHAASGIDRVCALESCSWGQFQIMGYHWKDLGYDSIEAFVAAMELNESAQLDAFVRFVEADPALHKALKARKFAEFARIYNGPDYKDNLYDVKLQRAYERFSPASDRKSDKEQADE